MGSAHSTPQTAHMSNPTPHTTTFEVTPNVIKRLENSKQMLAKAAIPEAIKTDRHCCNCCTCEKPQEISNEVLHKRSVEVQENQYHKTMEKLEMLLGKPVKWSGPCEAQLQQYRKELIKCYKQYTKEPLRCAESAKEFQDFIFREQFENILRAKEIIE